MKSTHSGSDISLSPLRITQSTRTIKMNCEAVHTYNQLNQLQQDQFGDQYICFLSNNLPQPVLTESFDAFIATKPKDVTINKPLTIDDLYSKQMVRSETRQILRYHIDYINEQKTITIGFKPHGLPAQDVSLASDDDENFNYADCWCCIPSLAPTIKLENQPDFHNSREYQHACRRLNF